MSASYKTLFTLWEKSSPRRDTTVEDYQKILYTFADFVQKKALTDIVRRDIIDFRDYLLDSGQSARTASHKVGILKTLFRTAINYEMIASNPAEHVRTPVNHDRKRRIAFSSDDLKRIFHSPIYTCAYRSVSGGGDACYWLPLLALFTGARIEELAQLVDSTGVGRLRCEQAGRCEERSRGHSSSLRARTSRPPRASMADTRPAFSIASISRADRL